MVVLESETYNHNKWGKIYNPIYRVTGWVDMQKATPRSQRSLPPPKKRLPPARNRFHSIAGTRRRFPSMIRPGAPRMIRIGIRRPPPASKPARAGPGRRLRRPSRYRPLRLHTGQRRRLVAAAVSERDGEPAFAPADVGCLDFESRSAVPITAGTYRYAGAADAIILSYALGDAPAVTVAVETFEDGPLRWDSLPRISAPGTPACSLARSSGRPGTLPSTRPSGTTSTLGFPVVAGLPHHRPDGAGRVPPVCQPILAGAASACAAIPKDPAGADLIRLFCVEQIATPATYPRSGSNSRPMPGPMSRRCGRSTAVPRGSHWTSGASTGPWRPSTSAAWALTWAWLRTPLLLPRRTVSVPRDHLRNITKGEVGTVDEVAKLTSWLLGNLPAEGRAILTKQAEETGDDGTITQAGEIRRLTRSRVERLLALLETDRFRDDARWHPARGVTANPPLWRRQDAGEVCQDHRAACRWRAAGPACLWRRRPDWARVEPWNSNP